MKKGQMFSTELVLASAIFIAGIVIFVSIWNSMLTSYLEEQQSREMQVSLIGISDMLVLSPGTPANWEVGTLSDASAFGLASSPNIISTAKAQALQDLQGDYQKVKENMGAGRFDVFMSINSSTNTLYTFGLMGDANESTVEILHSSRLALLDGEAVTINVQTWRTKGRIEHG
ncbi:MAG: hypothetical protein NTV88_02170 [Candidatus Micrarchaeota archaeon]|nr:hypothetical protein [Candidatus Micrarchaeota archaeon]